jgi:hypothetical protein
VAFVLPEPSAGHDATIAVLLFTAGSGGLNCTISGVPPRVTPVGGATIYDNVPLIVPVTVQVTSAPVVTPKVNSKPGMYVVWGEAFASVAVAALFATLPLDAAIGVPGERGAMAAQLPWRRSLARDTLRPGRRDHAAQRESKSSKSE